MSFACLYIPDFALQAVVRGEPELRSRSVVITRGQGAVVIAANQAARQAGVRVGMIGFEVEHLASIAIRPRTPAPEESAHAALLDLGFGFSPRVEDTAADALTLDLEGLERVFGAPCEMAQQLRERAAGLGLEANVAIAPNPDAAWLAARGFAGITIIDSSDTAERLGPLPVNILATSREILETLDRWGIRTFAALAALPTEQLSERLGQAGVELQQRARGASPRALIPAQPSSRFEEVMELDYDEKQLDPLLFLLGRMLRKLCARLTARGLAAGELRLALELAIESNIDSCSVELETSRQKAESSRQKAEGSKQEITKCFTTESTEDTEQPFANSVISVPSVVHSSAAFCPLPSAYYSLRLPVPVRDPQTLLKLLQLNLSARPPAAPVRKISLAAEPAKPRAIEGGLFAPIAPDPEKLEITLARIKAIVGEENFGSAELPDTYRPAAMRMARFEPGSGEVGSRQKAVGSSKQKAESRMQKAACRKQNAESSGQKAGDHPSDFSTAFCLLPTAYCSPPPAYCSLRFVRPPLPAEVRTNSNGAPTRIFFLGMKGDVISAAGPWRTSGDWWTEEGWAQDEWDVEIGRTGIRNWELGVREEARKGNRESGMGSRKGSNLLSLLPTPYSQLPTPRSSAVFRLYRDVATGQWFVRGCYD